MTPLDTYPSGGRTELWRTLSWHVGDRHADRLCWLIWVYMRVCRLRGYIGLRSGVTVRGLVQ